MRGMQRIYKRGVLESRFALAFIIAASLATTFSVVLVVLGMPARWPLALLAAGFAGAVYGRLCRPYAVRAGAGRIAALLALNIFILVACVSMAV
jgi:hypothetical protein